MLEELQRRNYSPSTSRGYILAVKQYAEYFNKSPEQLGAEDVRRFQLHLLNEKKLASGTVEMRMSALRFLTRRLLAVDENTVAFRWKDYAHYSKQRMMELTHHEFLRRFLQHVLRAAFLASAISAGSPIASATHYSLSVGISWNVSRLLQPDKIEGEPAV